MTCVLDECNQGREPCADPAVCCGHSRRVSQEDMTRRQQEADLRWQCRDQMDARQFAAHAAAGDFMPLGDRHAGMVGYAAADLDEIGVEAADAARVTATPIVVDDIKPTPLFPPLGKYKPLPTDWSAVTRWGAAVAICVLWTLIVIYRK